MKMRLGIAALLAMTAGAAAQNPLKLDYCTTPGGAGTIYKFTLTLDNHDNSWVPGQGFGWIIFGDIAGTQPPDPPAVSPLNDWAADPSYWPAGPFTEMTNSGGGHNGPTLGPIVIVEVDPNHPDPQDPLHYIYHWITWAPTAIGQSITWGGTSATLVPDGQLLWSNLLTAGGAPQVQWAVGNHISCGGGEDCYANCDESSSPPILNANDFQCFLNEFASGSSSANCDHSTATPTLNANDFQCFLNAFAAGCT